MNVVTMVFVRVFIQGSFPLHFQPLISKLNHFCYKIQNVLITPLLLLALELVVVVVEVVKASSAIVIKPAPIIPSLIASTLPVLPKEFLQILHLMFQE